MSEQEQNPKKISTPIQDMINDAQKDSTTGPLIGSIIIIVILIIGGLYFLGSLIRQREVQIKEKETFETMQNETLLEQTVQQSGSDDLKTIEADLEATNFDVLDSAIEDIEKEF